MSKHTFPICQKCLQRFKLLLHGFHGFFQKPDSLAHTLLSNVCRFCVQIWVNVLDPVAVVQNAFFGNTNAVAAQFIHALTFDHLAKLEIDVGLRIIAACFYLFCQRSILDRLFICHHTLGIQDRNPVIFLRIQLLIDFHRRFCILRLYGQQQFVIAKITLDRITPCIIPHLQKIGKHFHIDTFSGLQKQLRFQDFAYCL